MSQNDDLISRQAAIDHLKKRLYETALNNNTEHPYYEEIADNRVDIWLNELPSAQPEIVRCKDCEYGEQDKAEEPKKCDTCKHEKARWFSRCADCSDYELWEGKEE